MPLKRRSGGVVVSTGLRLHNKPGRSQTPHTKPLAAMKPRVGGLVVTSVAAMDAGINHELVRLRWADIEPADVTIPGNNYVWTTADNALNALPAGGFAKFGVQAGNEAPDWLKTFTGTVDVVNSKDNKTATCPLWWSTKAQNSWNALQIAMAARYDGDPRLKQVIACLAMANYMEPFILGSDSASDKRLWDAGLENPSGTVPGTQATAIGTMLTNTLNAWQRTRVELPLHNTWEIPKGTGTFINQQPWTTLRDFILPYVTTYGERLILTDYGLGVSDTAPGFGSMTLANATPQYAWMQLRASLAAGVSGAGPCAYQVTFGSDAHNGPNMLAIIQNCDDLGGSYLETSGYGAYLTTAEITAKDALLKANNGSL